PPRTVSLAHPEDRRGDRRQEARVVVGVELEERGEQLEEEGGERERGGGPGPLERGEGRPGRQREADQRLDRGAVAEARRADPDGGDHGERDRDPGDRARRTSGPLGESVEAVRGEEGDRESR